MNAKTLIVLLLLGHFCQITLASRKPRKSRHYHNSNVKKSFLADAMNEMEYGSAHAQSENKTDKTDPNRIVSIRRIYPSNMVKIVEENNKDGTGTPILANQPSNVNDDSNNEKDSTNPTENIAPSVASSQPTVTVSKDISNAISLLKSFVKKLLTQNSTETANASNVTQNKIVTQASEKKDTFKAKNSTNDSPIAGKPNYNLTAVYQLRNKQKEDLLNRLKEEEENLQRNLQEKQRQIEQLKKVEDANTFQLSNPTTSAYQQDNNNKLQNPTQTVPMVKASPPISQNTQNDTNEAQFKFDSLKGIPPELLVKLKEILDEKKRQKANLISKQQETSRKAFETAKKMVKAAFARKQLYKAEQDFFEKVREMMNKTSEANLIDNKNTTVLPAPSSGDGESDMSSVKDYIHSLEAEQKVVESVERRTKPTPQTTDIEAFQSASGRLSPTSSMGPGPNTLPSAKSSNQAQGTPTANRSLEVDSAAGQSKSSTAFDSALTQTIKPNQALQGQNTNDKVQAAETASKQAAVASNSTVTATPGQTKSSPGGVPPNGQAPGLNILNNLNRTKGPDEKSVEAAAHLEEKVAEQQDEMYEDLIRHTLNKGRLDDDDDDDDYEDEEAATRDRAGRPAQYGQMQQENYGDFQDSDERAHSRSEVMNKDNNPKLHYIDENAIFSLKKDYISRPPKDKTKHIIKKSFHRRFSMKKHFRH